MCACRSRFLFFALFRCIFTWVTPDAWIPFAATCRYRVAQTVEHNSSDAHVLAMNMPIWCGLMRYCARTVCCQLLFMIHTLVHSVPLDTQWPLNYSLCRPFSILGALISAQAAPSPAIDITCVTWGMFTMCQVKVYIVTTFSTLNGQWRPIGLITALATVSKSRCTGTCDTFLPERFSFYSLALWAHRHQLLASICLSFD